MNADDVKYKIEVMQAYAEGKEIEFTENEDVLHRANRWRKTISPIFNWEVYNYRVKPELIEKPTINWDHVSDKFNYLTLDEKGNINSAWLYQNKPKWGGRWWECHGSDNELAFVFKSLNPGNCEPQDSLICRPGFE